MQNREIIARRVAKDLKDGDFVNLGIGMPTMVANYISSDLDITFQSENGFLGLGPPPAPGEEDKDIANAGAQPVTIVPGGCTFDSAFSFVIIRGGHIDVTVLGALEVDEKGNLANWMIPGKMVPGMGGAMDLVVGAKKVIVAMEHCTKTGEPKILKDCTLPLTAANQVDMIVTEKAVIEVTDDGLLLRELAAGLTIEHVLESTGANMKIAGNLKIMEI